MEGETTLKGFRRFASLHVCPKLPHHIYSLNEYIPSSDKMVLRPVDATLTCFITQITSA